jgi:hypothetical protein
MTNSDAPPFGPTLVWGYGESDAFNATGLTCIDEPDNGDLHAVELTDPEFVMQDAAGATVWLAVVAEGVHTIAGPPYEQRTSIRAFIPRYPEHNNGNCCHFCVIVLGICPQHGFDIYNPQCRNHTYA